MAKFGKFDKDGNVITEATECALSGAGVSTQDGSVREKVKGTPYFYRVHGSQYGNMTDEIREQLADEARTLDKPKINPTPMKASTPKPSEVKE